MKKKRKKRVKRPKTRTRSVNFLGIESQSEARDTLFMQETRHALANQVQSPLDRLIEEEEQDEETKREIQRIRFTNRIVKYAGLTSKQRACYNLLTRRKNQLTLKQAARKLGISEYSVWSRYNRARRKIRKTGIRILEGRRINNLITAYIYRAKLRNVFHLYFERAWLPDKIAKKLKKSLASIYKNIRTLRWLAHAYSPAEAAKIEPFEVDGKKISVSVKKPSQKPEKWPK